MKTSNLSDAKVKTLVKRKLNELSENFSKKTGNIKMGAVIGLPPIWGRILSVSQSSNTIPQTLSSSFATRPGGMSPVEVPCAHSRA